VQLTDTDVAFVLKGFMRRSKGNLVRHMKIRAELAHETTSFRCDAFEIMTICSESHRDLVKRNEDTNLILRGLRRNGQFAWRPDLLAGKLIKADEQPWAAGLKMGSHRYPQSWLASRFDWLDAKGVPIQPDWRRTLKDPGPLKEKSEDVATEEIAKFFAKDQYTWEEDRFTQDHIVKMCGVEIKVPVVDLEFDEMGAMPEELAELLKTSHRDRDRKPPDEWLQKKISKKIGKASGESLSRLRLALCGFADELHKGLEEDLQKQTRMEIFRKLKFVSRCSAKGTNKIVKKTTMKHVKKMLLKKKVRHDHCCIVDEVKVVASVNKAPRIRGGFIIMGVLLFCAGPS
jgi:hypothetical protein